MTSVVLKLLINNLQLDDLLLTQIVVRSTKNFIACNRDQSPCFFTW